MNAKEKALEIYLSVKIPDYCFAKAGMDSDWKIHLSKKNAIYLVEEILEATKKYIARKNYTVDTVYDSFWQEVKSEIYLINK